MQTGKHHHAKNHHSLSALQSDAGYFKLLPLKTVPEGYENTLFFPTFSQKEKKKSGTSPRAPALMGSYLLFLSAVLCCAVLGSSRRQRLTFSPLPVKDAVMT